MAKSLSEQLISQTVDTILAGRRNIRETDLEPFFLPPSPVGTSELVDRVQTSQVFRAESSLESLSPAQAANYIATPSSRQKFSETLRAMGIEETYVADMVKDTSQDLIPEAGYLSTFLEKPKNQESTLTVEEIREKLATVAAATSGLETPDSSQHILQEPTLVQLDEDSRVRQGINKTHDYARTILGVTK